MADRYWRGLSTDLWDATAGSKWADTAGGATGAAVPTAADDVFFDATSANCTISGSRVAKSINCTGYTGTLAGASTPALTISGSLTLVAGMTLTYAGTTTFNGTGTLTSGGKSLREIIINGAGITVTLGDALTITGLNALTITRGTFDTANYNVTGYALVSSNSNTRTINLGSSTITLSQGSGLGALQLGTITNLTFNAGTSTIDLTDRNAIIASGGLTFYNVTFSSFSSLGGIKEVRGANTFNNLSTAVPSTAGYFEFTFNAPQIINGTFSTISTVGSRRVLFRGATYGIAHTLTINSTPSLTDADFRDIYVVGTAAPISGTRIGNLRGCRGITFDTPKTVYWNLAAGGNWSANAWAASSGGAVSTDNFPLAQDTAVIENTGLNTSATITLNSAVPYTGTVDMSGRTNAMTLSVGTYTIYGDWKNGSGTAIAGSGTLTFSGRNTQTITSAGKTFGTPVNITVDSYGGSVELADALNIGGNNLTVTNGTFDTKNYNVTASVLSSSNNNVRTITLGSSTITLSGTAAPSTTGDNITFNADTSTINFTNASANGISAGAQTFYDVTFSTAGTGTITLSGAITFNSLSVTAPSAAGIRTLALSSSVTITGTLTVAGATAVRRMFVRSGTLGTTRTLTVGTLSATDCDFRDITIAGAAAGSSPTRAGDCGGNSGITFPASKTVYWNLAGTQNWSATAWAPGSGGTPNINNFPLAQDTAVFDNSGAVGTVVINASRWNLGTFDASSRTNPMSLNTNTNVLAPVLYGSWKSGTGLSIVASNAQMNLNTIGAQTITSNGVQFSFPLEFTGRPNSTIELTDALIVASDKNIGFNGGTKHIMLQQEMLHRVDKVFE
jgi:hypothetical protein